MKILKFVGASNREVLDQVRQLLGSEALIISNRRLEDGQIEVMAADPRSLSADFNDMAPPVPPVAPVSPTRPAPPAAANHARLAPAPSAPAASMASRAGTAGMAAAPERVAKAEAATAPMAPSAAESAPAMPGGQAASADPSGPAAASSASLAMEARLANFQGEMAQRLDGLLWGQTLQASSAKARLFGELLAAGFSATLARVLLEQAPQAADAHALRLWLRSALIERVMAASAGQELLVDAGVIALVGPTGVGKTTTIAKLAARCVALHGRGSLALITADSYRIAAQEQLQTFGRMMGVPVYPLRADADLKSLLKRLSDKRIILVDNIGLSQRDRKVASQLALLRQTGAPVRRVLVLNAAGQGETLEEVVQAYAAGDALAGCIITKLDEASRSATVLDAAIRHELTVHYVTHGQKVPEDLALPVAERLVDGALHPAGGGSGLYAPDEAGLAALLSHAQAQASGQAQVQASVQAAAQASVSLSAMARQPAQALGQQCLPWLLQNGAEPEHSAAADSTAGVAAFAAGAAWLRADPSCRLAYAAWKQWAGLAPADARAAILPPLAQAGSWTRAARDAWVTSCDRSLLAIHGQVALAPDLPRTTLEGVLLGSDRGHLLAAPLPALVSPFGRVSLLDEADAHHHGAALAGATGAAAEHMAGSVASARQAVLAQRMGWLQGELAQAPLVHMLEAAAPPGPLPADSLWMMACEPGWRVYPAVAGAGVGAEAGGATVGTEALTEGETVGETEGRTAADRAAGIALSAWAERLTCLPLSLSLSAGWEEAAAGWWGTSVGVEEVLGSVSAPPADARAGGLFWLAQPGVRLLVLRHEDGSSNAGMGMGMQLVLTNVPASQADTGRLAAWWMYAQRMRRAFDAMPAAWCGLGRATGAAGSADAGTAGQEGDGTQAMLTRALLAAQVGAVAWQAMHAGHAEPLRRALKAAVGWHGGDSSWQTTAALWRFFALQALAA